MQRTVTVAVDAMGGDYAPKEIIKGAVLAVQEKPEIKVILVGQKDVILNELSVYDMTKSV